MSDKRHLNESEILALQFGTMYCGTSKHCKMIGELWPLNGGKVLTVEAENFSFGTD